MMLVHPTKFELVTLPSENTGPAHFCAFLRRTPRYIMGNKT